jgi:trehalose 6-phosphate phosphatase
MDFSMLDVFRKEPAYSGIILDIDGTIVEIAPTPQAAAVEEEMRQLLGELAKQYAVCGVLTGRDAATAEKMLGLSTLYIAGNHGLETMYRGTYESAVNAEQHRHVLEEMQRNMTVPDGVVMEDKGLWLAFHFRQHPEAAQELRMVLEEKAARYRLQMAEGKMVLELGPRGGHDKGTALEKAVQRFSLNHVLYAGDDWTDIPALKAAQRLNGVAIGVMGEHAPVELAGAATCLVSSVSEMKQVLQYLVRKG